MPEVTITGWTKGCNTVAAIKEIREKAPMPLNEALDVVNRVLRNEQVIVSVSTLAAAQSLADVLRGLGLLASPDGDSAKKDVPMQVKAAQR
jgi:hypothetical protein